jgi:hypothetical protein
MMFEFSDQIKIAACIAAFLFTWRAWLIAAIFAVTPFMFEAAQTGEQFSFSMIILYCICAEFIKFKSEIRQALWAVAALSWIALVDYSFFSYETIFYQSYPFIIHALDCYIICHLLSNGGRQDVGAFGRFIENFIFSVRCRILWLSSFYRQPQR